MKHSIEELAKSEIKITVKLISEEFQKFFDKEVEKVSKKIELPGFRKGTAPVDMVKEKLPKEQYDLITSTAIDFAVQDSYISIIEQEKLEILGKPKVENVELKEDFSLEFNIIAAVFPEIKLPDFKEVIRDVKKTPQEIDETEIESSINWLRKTRAKFTLKTEAAEEGDWVEVEYMSEQIENNKNFQDKFILGDGKFVPGFEKEVIGLKTGDKKEFSVVFPKDYAQKDLAEKDVKFNLTVKNVHKMELPKLTDEWVKTLGDFKIVNDLKKSLREGLVKEKEYAEKAKTQEEILEKIREKTEIKTPETLIKEVQVKLLEDLKAKISQQFKAGFGEYLNQIKKTEQEILDSFRKIAENRAANSLILNEIIKTQEILASPEEIEKKTKEFLNKSNSQLDLTGIDPNQIKSYYKNEIETEKAFEFLEGFLQEN